jgi:hypothetical protein
MCYSHPPLPKHFYVLVWLHFDHGGSRNDLRLKLVKLDGNRFLEWPSGDPIGNYGSEMPIDLGCDLLIVKKSQLGPLELRKKSTPQ